MSTTYIKISCIGCGTQTHTTMEKTLESPSLDMPLHTVYQAALPRDWSMHNGKYNCPDCTTHLIQKENQLS